MKIGIMDSGIGGLTVLKECLSLLPAHEYLYYADSNNAPYGTKSKEEVYRLTARVVDYLVKMKADIIVIACNTATSAAAVHLRKKYDIPIIGMEPAIKPALTAARNKRILVAATGLTLYEQKFRDLITALDAQHRVDNVDLTELVAFAEAGDFSRNTIVSFLTEKLANFNLELYGSVVLGCTHFPLFRKHFAEVFPVGTVIIDGAVGTANRVKEFVTFDSNEPKMSFFLSGELLVSGSLFKRICDIIEMEVSEDDEKTLSKFK